MKNIHPRNITCISNTDELLFSRVSKIIVAALRKEMEEEISRQQYIKISAVKHCCQIKIEALNKLAKEWESLPNANPTPPNNQSRD